MLVQCQYYNLTVFRKFVIFVVLIELYQSEMHNSFANIPFFSLLSLFLLAFLPENLNQYQSVELK